VQVRDEGSVGVGADIVGVIVVVLGDRNPLCSGDLLFQVTGDDLLLLPNEATARSCAQVSSKVLRAVATAATRASCSQCVVAAAT
jgi:hypothetical protein